MKERDLEKFCPLPFTNLVLTPSGEAFPCCWKQDIPLGKLEVDGWEGVWNGKAIRQLRQEFLKGKPTTCAEQMRHMGCHRLNRHLLNRIEAKEVQTTMPRKLDLRLNGRCNLKCVMCKVWTQRNGAFDDTELWTRGPEEVFPYLEEVDILGGEPFVQRDTFQFIEEVTKVNPFCLWAFVTNGQWKYEGKIQETLEGIAIRWLQLSLDSLDPARYRQIRLGGELRRPLQNLEHLMELKSKRPALGLTVSFCIQKTNWQEVPDFIRFARERDLMLSLQFAYEPEAFSLLTSPLDEIREVVNFLREFYCPELEEVIAPLEERLTGAVPQLPKEAPILQV